jgi:hypothetical protein
MHSYFKTCTVQLLLFCTITNKCTINRQIIKLLPRVSTLLCHPQGACSSNLPGYTSMSNAVVDNTIYNFIISRTILIF